MSFFTDADFHVPCMSLRPHQRSIGPCSCAPVLVLLVRARGPALYLGVCLLGFPAVVCAVTPVPPIASLCNAPAIDERALALTGQTWSRKHRYEQQTGPRGRTRIRNLAQLVPTGDGLQRCKEDTAVVQINNSLQLRNMPGSSTVLQCLPAR